VLILSLDELPDEDQKIMVLLAVGEISGFNHEAPPIPIKEIELYVKQNFEDLYQRVQEGKKKLADAGVEL
jgi:hypothetical protein